MQGAYEAARGMGQSGLLASLSGRDGGGNAGQAERGDSKLQYEIVYSKMYQDASYSHKYWLPAKSQTAGANNIGAGVSA